MKAKEHSLLYYWTIAGEGWRTDQIIPYLMSLLRNEKQTATSRVWTRITDSISYEDTLYAKRASDFRLDY